MTGMNVRKYRTEDRKGVQDICYLSGFMGESAEYFWRHKQSFVEIWTSYYTEHEPESLYVATVNDIVVGYLTGCVDSLLAPKLADTMKRLVIKHRLFLRPTIAVLLARGLFDIIKDKQVPKGELIDKRYPAHLHINLLPAARGTGLGKALMESWFEQLKQSGSQGCHLCTTVENTHAVSFFERMGFKKYGIPSLISGIRGRDGKRLHQQIMVRDLFEKTN